jgi:3D (Asp-Asp-Asp) domain-containing protein
MKKLTKIILLSATMVVPVKVVLSEPQINSNPLLIVAKRKTDPLTPLPKRRSTDIIEEMGPNLPPFPAVASLSSIPILDAVKDPQQELVLDVVVSVENTTTSETLPDPEKVQVSRLDEQILLLTSGVSTNAPTLFPEITFSLSELAAATSENPTIDPLAKPLVAMMGSDTAELLSKPLTPLVPLISETKESPTIMVIATTPTNEILEPSAKTTLPSILPQVGTVNVVATAYTQTLQAQSKKVRVRLTFYSGKDDQWGDRVAWKDKLLAKRGRTAAADPLIFPYGTWINIPGFGKHRVEDTGSAVKSRKASYGKDPVIDLYVGDEKEVMRLAAITPEYVEITLL